ncbi:MAG: S9 family peptidase [Cyclobacteriaceae bacterium]
MKNILLVLCCLIALSAHAQSKRKLTARDFYRMQSVGDPQLSPEGNWVAYTLTTVDSIKDKRSTDLWMINWDGQQQVQLTHTPDGESSPRWSPDGKYLSFTSARAGLNRSQIWIMDRRGGEARKLTDVKGSIREYVWSPDGKKIALVLEDLKRPDSLKDKTANPIVIDRVHFKQDGDGYLERLQTHLYLFDLDTKKLDTLTSGKYDEVSPRWSPDGKHIAFVSNRTEDPDRNGNTDIFVIEARKGATFKQLTTWRGSDYNPRWSEDGKQLAWMQSASESNFLMYDLRYLCVMNADGSGTRRISGALDRNVNAHVWAGNQLTVLVEDDRTQYIANLTTAGQLTTVIGGDRIFTSLIKHPAGHWLTMMSDPQTPSEIYAVENGQLRRLTHHQQKLFSTLELARVEGFTSKSKDGTLVSNILYRAIGADPNQKQPTIFFIHGGPVAQDDYGFDAIPQMLAGAGYNVISVNYRGSSGRGQAFTKAIYADWGNKEVIDILGAADYAIAKGIADADKLAIGGWSYGGILTNYTIATDTRFKAAASGAGSSLQLSMFGVDQYITQFETELGVPWKNLDKYMKLSYPFLKVDKIKTPTLFMTGENDFNVPAVGSEQMYQAMRLVGTPTQLIVYPNQFHGIAVPSYQADRIQRYVEWFDKYLKGLTPVNINPEVNKK